MVVMSQSSGRAKKTCLDSSSFLIRCFDARRSATGPADALRDISPMEMQPALMDRCSNRQVRDQEAPTNVGVAMPEMNKPLSVSLTTTP